MEFNPQKQLAGLLEWMDQQMTLCHGKTAVIGISGGKDSSTVAALAVAAYGRENVYGVLMPNGVQPDIDYSQALVEHLNRREDSSVCGKRRHGYRHLPVGLCQ